MKTFKSLVSETECLASAWGFNFIESLEYIRDNFEDYRGTQVAREFEEFLASGELFTPQEPQYDDSMDGDHASALASAGWGTDEDYVYDNDYYD